MTREEAIRELMHATKHTTTDALYRVLHREGRIADNCAGLDEAATSDLLREVIRRRRENQ